MNKGTVSFEIQSECDYLLRGLGVEEYETRTGSNVMSKNMGLVKVAFSELN